MPTARVGAASAARLPRPALDERITDPRGGTNRRHVSARGQWAGDRPPMASDGPRSAGVRSPDARIARPLANPVPGRRRAVLGACRRRSRQSPAGIGSGRARSAGGGDDGNSVRSTGHNFVGRDSTSNDNRDGHSVLSMITSPPGPSPSTLSVRIAGADAMAPRGAREGKNRARRCPPGSPRRLPPCVLSLSCRSMSTHHAPVVRSIGPRRRNGRSGIGKDAAARDSPAAWPRRGGAESIGPAVSRRAGTADDPQMLPGCAPIAPEGHLHNL